MRRRSWLKQQPGGKTIRKKLIRWCGGCGLIGSALVTTVLIFSSHNPDRRQEVTQHLLRWGNLIRLRSVVCCYTLDRRHVDLHHVSGFILRLSSSKCS